MEDILKLASDLGKLIAKHQRYLSLRKAEDAAGADREARDLLEAMEKQQRKIAELEAGGKPVEPEDKHELQRLTGAVHSSAALQELAKAQADYMEMMNRVNKAIRQELDTERDAGA